MDKRQNDISRDRRFDFISEVGLEKLEAVFFFLYLVASD